MTKTQTQLLKLMHDVMTAERGGGGAEETIYETTEVDETTMQAGAEQTELADVDEDEEEEDVTQLQREMKDTTIGATTIGFPDAEGTRVQLGGDTELLDSLMSDD